MKNISTCVSKNKSVTYRDNTAHSMQMSENIPTALNVISGTNTHTENTKTTVRVSTSNANRNLIRVSSYGTVTKETTTTGSEDSSIHRTFNKNKNRLYEQILHIRIGVVRTPR